MQEIVRYTLTGGYLYLAYLSYSCPCSKILGCHTGQWALITVALSSLVLGNFLFGTPLSLEVGEKKNTKTNSNNNDE